MKLVMWMLAKLTKNPFQSHAFLQISGIPESLELNAPSDDPETLRFNIPETEMDPVTQEVQNVVENAEDLTLEMINKCSDLSPPNLGAKLNEINREEEVHSISGHLMLEDIGEVVGSFALETDTPEPPDISSSQEAEQSKKGQITHFTALESLEASQSDNVLENEAEEHFASLSSHPKDEDPKDTGLVESISDNTENNLKCT
ncbi:UNVERIFIED_CONTAM: hypothetical protein FKN15_052564 [Acipenser sinensis]